jgi:hypothetical protein
MKRSKTERLGTAAINRPFIPDIDDKWMIRRFGGMMTDRGKPKFSEKPGPLPLFISHMESFRIELRPTW